MAATDGDEDLQVEWNEVPHPHASQVRHRLFLLFTFCRWELAASSSVGHVERLNRYFLTGRIHLRSRQLLGL